MTNRHMIFLRVAWYGCLWCLPLVLFSGCASAPLNTARSDFYGGRPDRATQVLAEPSDVSRRDRLLFYMERGVILHYAGNYAESIATLLKAAELIKQQDVISATEQTGSLVTGEWITEYKGEYAERLLVHTYLMMGFLVTGRPESALVEARQALEVFDEFPKATARDHFTRALIAHCFELNGELNGAYIEYKKLAEQMGDPGPVADKLAAIAGRLGFYDDRETWLGHLDSGANLPKQENVAELLLFVGQGKSPVKIPRNIVVPPSIRFSFITYKERTRYFYQPVIGSVPPAGPVRRVTTDMNAVLKDSLNDRLARILAKETARAATKEVIARQMDDPLVEALVRIAFFVTEEPDTRAWETLPAYLTLIRLPLDGGSHALTVRTSGQGGAMRLPPIEVTRGRRFYHYSVRSGFAPRADNF